MLDAEAQEQEALILDAVDKEQESILIHIGDLEPDFVDVAHQEDPRAALGIHDRVGVARDIHGDRIRDLFGLGPPHAGGTSLEP